MIETIDDAPAGVLAFRAVGEVHAEDYKTVLDPAVAAVRDAHESLRFVYVLGSEFTGFSAGAAWQDTKLGLKNLTKWDRCAVVTDHDGIHHSVKALGWLIPGHVKVFEPDALDDALAWAAADD